MTSRGHRTDGHNLKMCGVSRIVRAAAAIDFDSHAGRIRKAAAAGMLVTLARELGVNVQRLHRYAKKMGMVRKMNHSLGLQNVPGTGPITSVNYRPKVLR
jgi:hypothetical protein